MKTITSALICLLSLSSCSSEPKEVIVPKRSIIYEEGKLIIDGTELPLPLQMDALVDLLGEPDQQFDLYNTIQVWHNEGIFTYQDKGDSTISSVAFVVKAQRLEFSPRYQFTGSVKVGELEIHAGTTLAELEEHEFKQATWAKDVKQLDKTKNYRVFVTYGLVGGEFYQVSVVTERRD